MATSILQRVLKEANQHVYGQERVIEDLLITILAQGHALLEGVPGLAKTKLAKTMATILGLTYNRIQFTPDVMPSDITGTHILVQKKNTLEYTFHKGPIFANFILADEINRAPPKTQSALLEAMEEKHVTLLGTRYDLPQPFIVIATQNPIEQEGTYPLPEAQQDRFMMKILLTYPREEAEERIALQSGEKEVQRILNPQSLAKLQSIVEKIPIRTELVKRITRLVRATRQHPSIQLGASPRAIISITRTAKASALLNGRHYVSIDDIKRVALPVLRHRIILTYDAERNTTPDEIITQLVKHHLS